SSKQLTVIRQLLKEASQIIHAGDPDRALLQCFYEKTLLHKNKCEDVKNRRITACPSSFG
ncbi:DNA topoisomerase III, partial [Vibrio anguillarum]|nr:DNA topoisomerase III [Vibrio anguillarum]